MSLETVAQSSVVKRGTRSEPYFFDKALATLHKLSYGLDLDHLDFDRIIMALTRGIVDGITVQELQRQMALAAADLTSYHPDYAVLAGRLEVAELHRSTQKSFVDYVFWIAHVDPALFADTFIDAVTAHGSKLDHALRHARDYDMTYSSFKTLERSYLLRLNGVVVERPQWLWMRVAVALHNHDLARVLETYELLSRGYYTHATPTLVNAGRRQQTLSSCFIVPTDCTSMKTTYDGIRDIASIFMCDGGVGVDLHNVPSRRADIARPQPGVIPILRVLDATVKLTSTGKESRPSALTACLPIWHGDVMEFIEIRNIRGQEELRTPNIFNALMIPDLFMRRVRDDGTWSLFDPKDVPDLFSHFGDDFTRAYIRYEDARKQVAVVPARVLWDHIIDNQIETGTPFVLYQDAINVKSNHQHLGVIHATNLCTEVLQYVSPDTAAVCTLSSIILPAFVTHDRHFDFDELHRVAKVAAYNTDRIIDINDYPTPQAKRSAETTRAIGIGVQGLADVFMMMHIPFDSEDAAALNRDIFETLYHAALEASCDLARVHGPYPTWAGSPTSQLRLQFDLWNAQPSRRYDFDALKTRIATYSLRNSLLTAQMPTASTSQITGVNDGTEPYISNMYVRRTLAGEFQVVNKWLVRDLIAHQRWNEGIRQEILRAHGSIQLINDVPTELKTIYRTAWEIPQRRVVDMAAERGPFICQSQSMTIYMAVPTAKKLTSMYFHAWESGLKTGMYYLRSQPSVFPDPFGLMPTYPSPEPFNRCVNSEDAPDLSTRLLAPKLGDIIHIDSESEDLTYAADDIADDQLPPLPTISVTGCVSCSA
ncbi:putative ribonucleoside-diphosphate reductase large chain [Trametes cingulata]|nr:putative ribonucleoside-diphosphate reductase large chain [Trametes cingulata]